MEPLFRGNRRFGGIGTSRESSTRMTAAKIPFVEELKRRNRESRESWDLYASHRVHVTGLLRSAGEGPSPRRLCVMGAGNCNDLDLNALADVYDELHLVDLDGEALDEGIMKQRRDAKAVIKAHGRMDVTGCLSQLASEVTPDDDSRIDPWLDRIKRLPPFPQPSPFHVVVSLSLLTQLAEIALLILGGPNHPRGNDLLFALRNHHLRKLLEMTRPGGIAFLITDIVSSYTFPNLPLLDDRELSSAMKQQVAMKNFFTGANPYAMESLLQSDPAFKGQLASIEMLAPWRWNLGNRILLMSGVKVRRSSP